MASKTATYNRNILEFLSRADLASFHLSISSTYLAVGKASAAK